jgi:hypothetical protein
VDKIACGRHTCCTSEGCSKPFREIRLVRDHNEKMILRGGYERWETGGGKARRGREEEDFFYVDGIVPQSVIARRSSGLSRKSRNPVL